MGVGESSEQGKIRSRGKFGAGENSEQGKSAIAHLENWENWEQGKIRSRGKLGARRNWEQGGIGDRTQ